MKPLIIIFAVLGEPVGSILQEPWDHVTPVEVIDMGPTMDQLERDLRRRGKRIMEYQPQGCPE